MDVSVVISTYDRQDDLVECVDSLQRGFEVPDEIVVVDDGDYDHTRERLETAGLDEVNHVEGDSDGLPASRNRGVDETTGEVVCFIDDDVVVPPNWLREVTETYEGGDVDGVGGYVCNYNPKGINKADVESFGYRALTAIRLLCCYDRVGDVSPIGILWAPHVFMTAGVREVETLQGCNMTFSREVLEDHRFEEWYGTEGSSACEEIDMCSRVSADGYRLAYNPRAVALHKRSVSDDSRTSGPNYDNVTNLTYFVARHPRFGAVNVALLAVAIAVYATLQFDPGYLRGVLKGYRAARRRGKQAGGSSR